MAELTGFKCPRCQGLLHKSEDSDFVKLECNACGYSNKQLKRLT